MSDIVDCLTCHVGIRVLPMPRGGRALVNPEPAAHGTVALFPDDGLARRIVATEQSRAASDRNVLEFEVPANAARYVEHDTTCASAARIADDVAVRVELSSHAHKRSAR